MQGLHLLGGYTAEELFPLVNFILIHWVLLAFLPRWKHTKALTLICPIAYSALYTLIFLSVLIYQEQIPGASFTSLKGITIVFEDPSNLFAGWVHYVVFDGLVGRWIVCDSVERGASILFHCAVVFPCLFFTLMSGPIGFMLYMLLRNLLPDGQTKPKKA